MKIKSSYNATIVLPPNVPVYPGAEVDYPHWDKYKDNPAIAWYVEQGHLSVGKASKKDEGKELPDREVVADVQFTEEVTEPSQAEVEDALDQLSEDEEKESLIAQLAELGVKADKRSSVEKLQEKLDEALAK